MPKVSVIIPIYNVEPYLRRGLDSLVNQTLNDIEIICINDGSTDNSLEILEEYASKDNRIKLIDLPQNTGAGSARNKGLEIAKGEYFGFVDPDDAIDLNYYEELYKKAVETDADIVKCERIVFETNGNRNISKINENIKKRSKFEFTYEWTTAIYRTSIITENEITIPNLSISEDIVFLNKVLIKSNKVEVIDNVKYYYYRRDNSLNAKMYDADKIDDALKAIQEILLVYNRALDSSDINNEDYIKQYYRNMSTILFHTVRKTDSKDLQLKCAQKYIELFNNCKLQNKLQLLLEIHNSDFIDYVKYNNPKELLRVCQANENKYNYIFNKLRQTVRKDICDKSINNCPCV